MKNRISSFFKDERGATAIEYGLIAAGISVAIIAVVNGLGVKLTSIFHRFRPSSGEWVDGAERCSF
jgi:pilus assembly protein Flp/PilA